MIRKFDKSNVEDIRKDVVAAIQMALAKHGIEPTYQGGRYSPEKFSIKIDLNIMAESESGEEMPASFPGDAARVGIPKNCYGLEFNYRGARYKVSGVKTRNRKYPVLAQCLTGVGSGRIYKMDPGTVNRALSRAHNGGA